MNIVEQQLEVNDLTFNVATLGEGPLVIFCHGFPELWISWKAQMTAVAEAGYRVAAPDMRGYGGSSKPDEVEAYSIFHLIGDVVGIVKALGEETAVIVGHDWGAYVAWQAALMRPDIFRGVVGLSVPFMRRPEISPLTMLERTALRHEAEFYQLWFQEPGVAEKGFESDVRAMQTGMLYTCSGEASEEEVWRPAWPTGTDQTAHFKANARRPSWLSEEDLEIFVSTFEKNGYRGPLNWYRNIELNWELSASLIGCPLSVPALFMIGEKDLTLSFSKASVDSLEENLPTLTKKVIVPGAGHWLQQEFPDVVNRELLEFLEEIDK